MTPPIIHKAPIPTNHVSVPEKYSGKKTLKIMLNNTDQQEYVTFKQRAFPAPILSIDVYQQKNDSIPTKAVMASIIQQGA